MKFPDNLRECIATLTDSLSTNEIKELSDSLSAHYRSLPHKALTSSNKSSLVYLITRLPSTFAVLCNVFEVLKSRISFPIRRILDLGSGPCTALWALQEVDFLPEEMLCVEKDPGMLEIGKTLYAKINPNCLVNWHAADLEKSDFPQADLVIASYVSNELSDCEAFFHRLAVSSAEIVVIVEPGTPDGFKRILKAREKALQTGWHLIAPCAHEGKCPLEKGWCHFYARVERSKEHRLAKGGTLGYEDEKYSYLILSKSPCIKKETPLLFPPVITKGYVEMGLCQEETPLLQRVLRKDKEAYKKAKKLNWGDFFPIP